MVWFFFARGDETLRLEARVENPGGAFVLAIWHNDEAARIEHFPDGATLRRRLTQVEMRLEDDRWVSASPPIVILETRDR